MWNNSHSVTLDRRRSQMANSSTNSFMFFFKPWLAPNISLDGLSCSTGSPGSLVLTTWAREQFTKICNDWVLLSHLRAMWFQSPLFHSCSHWYLRKRVLILKPMFFFVLFRVQTVNPREWRCSPNCSMILLPWNSGIFSQNAMVKPESQVEGLLRHEIGTTPKSTEESFPDRARAEPTIPETVANPPFTFPLLEPV